MNDMNIILKFIFTFSFTFRAFGGQFYPKRPAMSTFIRRKKREYIAVGTVRMFLGTSAEHFQLLG